MEAIIIMILVIIRKAHRVKNMVLGEITMHMNIIIWRKVGNRSNEETVIQIDTISSADSNTDNASIAS